MARSRTDAQLASDALWLDIAWWGALALLALGTFYYLVGRMITTPLTTADDLSGFALLMSFATLAVILTVTRFVQSLLKKSKSA